MVDHSLPPWIAVPRPTPKARLRLFCFPYAGGGGAPFRSWPANLPVELEMCLVQLPGRESRWREQPYHHLPSLIETLAEVIRPYQDIPFAFFGHSMGALIAFELARYLQQWAPRAPVHLFVSGRRAPHLPERETPLHRLPDAQFIEALKKRYNGIPQVILEDPELLELFLPTLRADLTLLETYVFQAGPLLDCPISAYGGLQDVRVEPLELEAWRAHTQNAFYTRMFPGAHFYLQTEQTSLLNALVKDLRLEPAPVA